MAMTREEALLKLLALEPEPRERIAAVTGWPVDEANALIDRLLTEKRLSYGNGPHRTGRRKFYPRRTTTDGKAHAL